MRELKPYVFRRKNEKDVEEVSAEITKGLEIVYVESMDEVLEQAFYSIETSGYGKQEKS